jgi:putative nucleotidyltransferase with HDIG domain
LSFYRFKQFLWSLSFKLSKREEEYLSEHLNSTERGLFKRLSIAEQRHSIRVALDVEKACRDYDESGTAIDGQKLVKAALLHDIGKIFGKLNVIEKSILVILNKLSKGKIKRYSHIKKINVYYNHADMGAELLKGYEIDESTIYLVRNHHRNIKGDAELEVLADCDNIN